MRWRRRHRTGPHHLGETSLSRWLQKRSGGVRLIWPGQPWQPAGALAHGNPAGVGASLARKHGTRPRNGLVPEPRRPATTRSDRRLDPVASPAPAQTMIHGDGDLIRAAQTDPAEFAAVYERYADPIYRYCMARVGTPADAEDATSQTFVRAYGALRTFRPRSDLIGDGVRSWLFTIAHNVVVSGYRDRRPTSQLDKVETLIDPDPPPDEQAIAGERRDVLRGSVARLSDDQRRVVELRLAGLSGPEIATVLGRSHGAIKMVQFRAIERLRALLADRLAAEPATEVPHDQR